MHFIAGSIVRLAAALALLSLGLSACADTPDRPAAAASPVKACINLGGALEAPVEGDWGYRVRRQDLQRISQAGFDTVRLPVRWSAHTGDEPPYSIQPDLLARVDEIIAWADAVDLNIIVNVHHYAEVSEDPDAHLDRLEAIWTQLSEHWRGGSDRLWFEFLNEPYGALTARRIDQLNARLLTRIRQYHPDRWVVLGGGDWGLLRGLEATRPDHDPKVITTFHLYEPFDFTHQDAPWATPYIPPLGTVWGSASEKREIEKTMARAAKFRARTGMPVFLGEFGVYQAVPVDQRAKWIGFVRRAAEARDIGWCHWDFATTFPLYDIETEAWISPLLSALVDD